MSGKTEEETFISPGQLAKRWDCSQSSVRRIAMRAGLTTYYLGTGKNGMLRYSIKEVRSFEESSHG